MEDVFDVTAIRDGVAAYLERQTGVRALGRRSRAAGGYPVLVVQAKRAGSVLFAGGRQVEQTCELTVQAADDRERIAAPGLLEQVSAALLRGVPCMGRTLRPEGLATDGDTLTFTVTVCAVVPQPEDPAPDVMRSVHVEGV